MGDFDGIEQTFEQELYHVVAYGERNLLTREEMADSLESVAEDIRS